MVEKNYPSDPCQVTLEPGAAQAIKKMNQAGYKVIIISNQSGVARGYFSETQVNRINHRLKAILAHQGAHLDAIFYCPHHPQGTVAKYAHHCPCRKPQPGLLLTAAQQLSVDLAHSFMAGDRHSDLQAALNSGCRPILVRTGYGKDTEEKLKAGGLVIPGLLVFDNLSALVDGLIGQGELG